MKNNIKIKKENKSNLKLFEAFAGYGGASYGLQKATRQTIRKQFEKG